jgi:hypothetical protein
MPSLTSPAMADLASGKTFFMSEPRKLFFASAA